VKKIFAAAVALMSLLALSGVAQKVIDSGKFLYQTTSKTSSKTEIAAEELFKIEELDPNRLKITSNFVAKSQEIISQFETDKLFNETIIVDKDWNLREYSLQSETVRGKLTVTVKVEGQIAKIQFYFKSADGKEQSQAREVILEDEFVTTGIAAGQLIVIQKIITLRMKEQKRTFLALDPTNIEKAPHRADGGAPQPRQNQKRHQSPRCPARQAHPGRWRIFARNLLCQRWHPLGIYGRVSHDATRGLSPRSLPGGI
jgi:hypothetical protein